jgi:signal transduction histidine kinase
VVVAHGGTIRASGAPGGGTAVIFELPILEEDRLGTSSAAMRGSVAT